MGKRKTEEEIVYEGIKTKNPKILPIQSESETKVVKKRNRSTNEGDDEVIFISMNKRPRSNTIDLQVDLEPMHSNSECYFQQLNVDLLIHIFSFLNKKENNALACSCRFFAIICKTGKIEFNTNSKKVKVRLQRKRRRENKKEKQEKGETIELDDFMRKFLEVELAELEILEEESKIVELEALEEVNAELEYLNLLSTI